MSPRARPPGRSDAPPCGRMQKAGVSDLVRNSRFAFCAFRPPCPANFSGRLVRTGCLPALPLSRADFSRFRLPPGAAFFRRCRFPEPAFPGFGRLPVRPFSGAAAFPEPALPGFGRLVRGRLPPGAAFSRGRYRPAANSLSRAISSAQRSSLGVSRMSGMPSKRASSAM